MYNATEGADEEGAPAEVYLERLRANFAGTSGGLWRQKNRPHLNRPVTAPRTMVWVGSTYPYCSPNAGKYYLRLLKHFQSRAAQKVTRATSANSGVNPGAFDRLNASYRYDL